MSIREVTCKCGRRIIANDNERKVSHELPECEWFKSLMASAAPHETSVEFLDTETGEKV